MDNTMDVFNSYFKMTNPEIFEKELKMEANPTNYDHRCAQPLNKLPADAGMAMAFIPFQKLGGDLYNDETALEKGTLFPDLDKPFKGKAGCM